MTIEPTAVYSPRPVDPGNNGGGYQGGQYYVINEPVKPNIPRRVWNSIPQQNPQARVSGKLPEFLRHSALNNRAIVLNMWILAMIVISFDEWHNLGILPRPARLWDASLVYAILVVVGFVDIMVPIANALAIGYTLILIIQYYQGNITPQGNTTNANVPAGTGGIGAAGNNLNSGINLVTGNV